MDETYALIPVGLVDEICRSMDVLLQERPPEVICPEMKRDLPGLFPFGEPRRLYVRDVIQVDSRESDHLKVAGRRRIVRDDFLQRRVAGLETPRNERREPAILVLQRSDHLQMLDDIFVMLEVTVHHGRRGPVPDPVRLPHNRKPVRTRPLEMADLLLDS